MKVKVAVVAFSAPPFGAGGVATAHYNLYRGLGQMGFAAKLFTFGDVDIRRNSTIVRNGSPRWFSNFMHSICKYGFWILAPGHSAYQLADILASQWGARRMAKAIKEFAPDAIVLSDHGAPGLAIKKTARTRIILVSHHNPARFVSPPAPGKNSKLDARLAVWLEQHVVNKADVVVCPSGYMQGWFRRTFRFSNPVRVIPNLLDEGLIRSIRPSRVRSGLRLRTSDILIFMPSAGALLKGGGQVSAIITALAKGKPRIRFYIPGTVPQDAAIKDLVFSPGQLPYEKHIANLKACDFGISPSLMENYSMALLEAVSCGVPMVAYDTGGNKEIVASGKNGLLAKEGDLAGLIKQAAGLLNRSKLKQMKKSTVAYTRTELAPRKALLQYAQLVSK